MKIEQIPPGLMLTDFICEIDDCFEDAEYFYSNRSTDGVWQCDCKTTKMLPYEM